MSVDPLNIQALQPADLTKAEVTPEQKLQKLKGASTDFEAMLIHQMLEDMEKTLEKGNLVSEGLSGDIYSGMLTTAIAKSMAEHQSMGLANQIFQNVVQHEPDLKQYLEAHPEQGHMSQISHRVVDKGNWEGLQTPVVQEVAPNQMKALTLISGNPPETPLNADNVNIASKPISNP